MIVAGRVCHSNRFLMAAKNELCEAASLGARVEIESSE